MKDLGHRPSPCLREALPRARTAPREMKATLVPGLGGRPTRERRPADAGEGLTSRDFLPIAARLFSGMTNPRPGAPVRASSRPAGRAGPTAGPPADARWPATAPA